MGCSTGRGSDICPICPGQCRYPRPHVLHNSDGLVEPKAASYNPDSLGCSRALKVTGLVILLQLIFLISWEVNV